MLHRTLHFFPIGGQKHRTVLIASTVEDGQAECLDKYRDGINPPEVITDPGTNWAQRSLTLLMCPMPFRYDKPATATVNYVM